MTGDSTTDDAQNRGSRGLVLVDSRADYIGVVIGVSALAGLVVALWHASVLGVVLALLLAASAPLAQRWCASVDHERELQIATGPDEANDDSGDETDFHR